MVTSRELQTRLHFSARGFPLPTSDCMTPTQPGQIYSSLRPPHSSRFSLGMDFSPCSISDLPGLNSVQLNGVDGLFKGLPPLCESSSPSIQPHLPHGLGVSASIIDASRTCPKRFLVVDQSGNHTRLFFNPFPSPPQNQIVSSKTPPGVLASCNEKLAVQVEKQSLLKPVIQEKWNENHLTDGGSEMHEDTNEIDALLYSDSDDEYDENDADQENDEVTSRARTPFGVEEGYDKGIQFEGLIEEVASSDGSTKRQRLLDGRYKISSSLVDGSPIKLATSCKYKDDAESSVVHEINSFGDSNSMKRLDKVKIRETLNILKSIIPGLKSKDPLLIIDKAIDYLKSLKYEAEAESPELATPTPQVFNGAVG